MTEAVQKEPTETTDEPIITITDEAAERLQEEMDRQEGATALRLMVFPGGCAGLQYAMSFAKGEPEEIESIIETGSIPIYTETQVVDLLRGSTIRYVNNLIGGGFQVDNPNADDTCGCGKSFS